MAAGAAQGLASLVEEWEESAPLLSLPGRKLVHADARPPVVGPGVLESYGTGYGVTSDV